jgi:hypothetical protein
MSELNKCPKCKSEMTEKLLFTSKYYECEPCEAAIKNAGDKVPNDVTFIIDQNEFDEAYVDAHNKIWQKSVDDYFQQLTKGIP